MKNSSNKDRYAILIQHIHVYIIGIANVFYLFCIIHILLFVDKYSFNLSALKSYSIRNV